MVREYTARRQLILDALQDFPKLSCFPPQGTFFVWINIKSLVFSSYAFCRRLLDEERVVTVPGSGFGSAGEGYVRISFVTSREQLQLALNRIKAFVERIL